MEAIFSTASSVMTVVSFGTFAGIVWWAYARRNQEGWAQAAALPFADELTEKETGHG